MSNKIDILLPTNGKRMDGLKAQISSILNQTHKDIHLWILMDGCEIEVECIEIQDNRVTFISTPEERGGNYGHGAIKWALSDLPLTGEFVWMTGDDDCLLPWGFEGLVHESEGYDMVTGVCLAVTRGHTWAGELTALGVTIHSGMITGSSCIYRRDRLLKVGYDDSCYEADWVLIKKMLDYPCKQTLHTIAVMPQYV